MHIPSLLFAAAISMRIAYADFIVITEAPIPTSLVPSFTDTSAAKSWTTSVGLNFKIAWASYTNSLGDPYKSSVTSVQSEIKDFAASASNYSIPAAVTDPATTTTIIGPKPSWYTALPSDAYSFKEAEITQQRSVLADVINRHATTSKTSNIAAPTAAVGLGAGLAMAAAAGAAFL